jgi:hypothetical protein
MIRRIAPSKILRDITNTHTEASETMSKKRVSFGDSTVHEVERIDPVQAKVVWWNKEEMDDLIQADRFQMWRRKNKKSDDENFTSRGLESGGGLGEHVRLIVKVYRMKQSFNDFDPEVLRRTAQHSSKQNAKYALEMGRKDYIAAYGKGSLVTRAKQRMSQVFR